MLFRKDRPEGYGGGVLIYAHFSLSPVTVSLPLTLCPSIDIVSCSVKLPKKGKVTIIAVYRPPNCNSGSDERLLEAIRSINKLPFKTVIIGGDFNYPEIDWSANQVYGPPRVYSFLDAINDKFLTNC